AAAIATYKTDLTAPTVGLSFPSGSSYDPATWTGTISGTAADTTGSAGVNSAVASVSVSIHDTTAATYWNGSSWASDSSGEVYNTATGTTSWTLALAASQLTS